MTPKIVHYDEASNAIISTARRMLDKPWIERLAIVDDLFGTLRLLMWLRRNDDIVHLNSDWPAIDEILDRACGAFWTGSRFVTSNESPSNDHSLCENAWEVGQPIFETGDRLRYIDRHRSRTSWFMPLRAPMNPDSGQPRAPVVVFYSFKGGMGRTTAAAAYVLRQASNRRVVAIDLDLDAPGLGRLLSTDSDGTINQWGTVDFLVEHRQSYPLSEYRHVCARSELNLANPPDVFPVGRIDDLYLRKLAKIDLDIHDDEALEGHPVGTLLARVRGEFDPDLIVVDCRAGLSPISGFMLSPLADVHVLFSTASEQALDGLTRIVHRLGADRLHAGLPQAECVLVHAMLPGSTVGGNAAQSYFNARAEDIYRDHYYQSQPSDPAAADDETIWTLDDLALPEAPHRAVAVPYREHLADFRDLADVLDIFEEAPYRTISSRIDARLNSRSTLDPGDG